VKAAYELVKNGDYENDFKYREMQSRKKEGAWGKILDFLLDKFADGNRLKFYLCKMIVYFIILFAVLVVFRGLFTSAKKNEGYFRFTMHPKFNLRTHTPCNEYVVFLERDFYQKYDYFTQKKIFFNAETAKIAFFKLKCDEVQRKIDILTSRLELAGHE
jgi:hypothetical protein